MILELNVLLPIYDVIFYYDVTKFSNPVVISSRRICIPSLRYLYIIRNILTKKT